MAIYPALTTSLVLGITVQTGFGEGSESIADSSVSGEWGMECEWLRRGGPNSFGTPHIGSAIRYL
jgi:hypothetical protein